MILVALTVFTLAAAGSATDTYLFASSYAGTVTVLKGSTVSYGTRSAFSLEQGNVYKDCGVSPSWLTYNWDTNSLFCLDEGNGEKNGSLTHYHPHFGNQSCPFSLSKVSHLETLSGPVSATVYGDSNNSALALAHYAGGAVSTWDLHGKPVELSHLQDIILAADHLGPNSDRQTAPFAHQTVQDPSGKYILVPDLGSDLVRVFSIDKSSNKLTEEDPLELPPGSGPRHLAFLPAKTEQYKSGTTYMYVVTELTSMIYGYAVTYKADGGLSFEKVCAINTFGGSQVPEGAYAAEIQVTGDRRFLIVSNRGDNSFKIPNFDPKNKTQELSDSLATFSLQDGGELKFVQLSPAGGSFPRHFSLNHKTNYVAVALQKSSRVVILERDWKTGKIGNAVAATTIEGEVTSVVWYQHQFWWKNANNPSEEDPTPY